MTLYLRTGFWQLYDLNTYGTARLALGPGSRPGQVDRRLGRGRRFSADPATVAAISRGAGPVPRGDHQRPLHRPVRRAERSRRSGLEPPPMMWIFEWDIVTGDSAALDSIYAVSRDDLDAAIADGRRGRPSSAARRCAPWSPGPTRRPGASRSCASRSSTRSTTRPTCCDTLAAYRTMVLRHVAVAGHRRRDGVRRSGAAAEARYRQARDEHVPRYARRRRPAGLQLHRRRPRHASAPTATRRWPGSARALLALLVIAAAARSRSGPPSLAAAPARRCGRCASVRPGRGGWRRLARRRADWTGCWSGRSRAACWSPAAPSTPGSPRRRTWSSTLGAWLLFAALLRLLVRGRDPFHLWAAVGGVALLRTVILLVALVDPRSGPLLVRLLDRPDAAHRLHHRRVRRVLLGLRGRRRGPAATGTACVRRGAVGRLLVAVGLRWRVLGGDRRRDRAWSGR